MGKINSFVLKFIIPFQVFNFSLFAQSNNLCGSKPESSPPTSLCFMLPIEAGQGFVFGAGAPTPYTASLRIHPSLGIGDWGRLQIGGSAALIYTNPRGEFFGGGRISYRIYEFTAVAENPLAGIYVFAEYLKGTNGSSFAGGGIGFDLFSLFQASARGSYETESKLTYGELTVGTNLMYWLNPDCSCKPQPPEWKPVFNSSQDYYGIVSTNAQQSLGSLSFGNGEIIGKVSALSRDTILVLDNIESLKNYLTSKGLNAVASKMDDVISRSNDQAETQGYQIPADSPEYQKNMILSFVNGWCQAIH